MLTGTPDRKTAWQRAAAGPWDVIVAGGGITGAGILREGARLGLRVLLVEQNDFASGTSSRSSKLVHGGLRYLNNFQFKLTYRSVCERDTLLKQGDGLVETLPFIYPSYEGEGYPAWMMEFGLRMYGWMGRHWCVHETLETHDIALMAPGLATGDLNGGFRFRDAQTDDARLVLRVIREGTATGHAVALNYARVEGLLYDERGQVCGVILRDRLSRRRCEARAAAVVNATGAWADRLRAEVGAEPRLRPLRGSHLLFSHDRFPVYQAISFPHPDDSRPVFVFPWEGVTLLGTTDLDHADDLDREPSIAPEEVDYLLRAVQAHFPGLNLTRDDVLSTFAGVRPVISKGEDVEPSKESREHALWDERGLLTVTGGKLTTFRCIALDALRALRRRLPAMPLVEDELEALDPLPRVEAPPGFTLPEARRLAARYGPDVLDFAARCPAAERERIGELPVHWLELRWAARREAVLHLDDLLLRRVRLGHLLPDGGEALLPRIREITQAELGWSDARWEREAVAYVRRWHEHYGLPEREHSQT